jgi:hypothetical protein
MLTGAMPTASIDCCTVPGGTCIHHLCSCCQQSSHSSSSSGGAGCCGLVMSAPAMPRRLACILPSLLAAVCCQRVCICLQAYAAEQDRESHPMYLTSRLVSGGLRPCRLQVVRFNGASAILGTGRATPCVHQQTIMTVRSAGWQVHVLFHLICCQYSRSLSKQRSQAHWLCLACCVRGSLGAELVLLCLLSSSAVLSSQASQGDHPVTCPAATAAALSCSLVPT